MPRHRLSQPNLRMQVWFAGRLLIFVGLCLLATAWAATSSQNALRIYFVDVEGGQATLFVTPAKQSLLIDTGWPANEGRDADRIVAAAKNAGITKIDYVLITHFHTDHVGGAPQLAARIPIHGAGLEGVSGTIGNWKVQASDCQAGRCSPHSGNAGHRYQLGRRLDS